MKTAQVIDPVNVVGMGMGKKDGVDTGDLVADCLRSQVRGGVDQNVFAGSFDQDGGAGSFVPWVVRCADAAAAADHRDASGSAATEDCYLHGSSSTCSRNRLTSGAKVSCSSRNASWP